MVTRRPRIERPSVHKIEEVAISGHCLFAVHKQKASTDLEAQQCVGPLASAIVLSSGIYIPSKRI